MHFAALNADAYLHHVSLQSPQPDALSQFYGTAMQMQITPAGPGAWLCSGPNRLILIRDGVKNRLGHVGFAVRSPDALHVLRRELEARGVAFANAECHDLLSSSLSVEDPDGNLVLFGLATNHSNAMPGLNAALQHIAYGTSRLAEMVSFYRDTLGFCEVDRVRNEAGAVKVCFLRSNHEHHTIAIFESDRVGLDHHAYEVDSWNTIRDWADYFSSKNARITWGPGRHGPGNNLFIFIEDLDGNNIEISAELEVVRDRPVIDWPYLPSTLNIWGPARMRSS